MTANDAVTQPKSANAAIVESDPRLSLRAEEQANLTTKELDIAMMKKDNVDLGQGKTCQSSHMKPYLSRDHQLDIDMIDLEKTWKSVEVAARAVVGIENPKDILVASDIMMVNRDIDVPEMVHYFVYHTGTRAYTRTSSLLHYLTPRERPKLLILTYPKTEDHLRLLKEARLANIPIIAFCEINCPMQFVDDATIIPADCNESAVSCLFWLLGRMVLQMRGLVLDGHDWVTFDELRWYDEVVKSLQDPNCENEDYYGSGREEEEEEEDCTSREEEKDCPNGEDEDDNGWEVESIVDGGEDDIDESEDEKYYSEIKWVDCEEWKKPKVVRTFGGDVEDILASWEDKFPRH